MHRGYIKLWRKTKESRHSSDGMGLFGFFCWLLISMNHKTGWFLGDEIPPGSMATSYQSLAELTHESVMVIRRWLNKLINYKMVTKRVVRNKYTLVSVCNWDSYQNVEQADNKQTTSCEQADNKQTTSCEQQSKNVKNGKNVNNGKNVKKSIVIPDHLLDIWPHYLEMRKLIKKPATIKAQEGILSKLIKLSDDKVTQVDIVKQSIEFSYQGVFPLRDNNNGKPKQYGRQEVSMQDLKDQMGRVQLDD